MRLFLMVVLGLTAAAAPLIKLIRLFLLPKAERAAGEIVGIALLSLLVVASVFVLNHLDILY